VDICGTFYFMTSILDGYSRYLVHCEIREKMEEIDVEAIVQRARENFPGENPRIITDNGPQFVSKDFKQFVRICWMLTLTSIPRPVTPGRSRTTSRSPGSSRASSGSSRSRRATARSAPCPCPARSAAGAR